MAEPLQRRLNHNLLRDADQDKDRHLGVRKDLLQRYERPDYHHEPSVFYPDDSFAGGALQLGLGRLYHCQSGGVQYHRHLSLLS